MTRRQRKSVRGWPGSQFRPRVGSLPTYCCQTLFKSVYLVCWPGSCHADYTVTNRTVNDKISNCYIRVLCWTGVLDRSNPAGWIIGFNGPIQHSTAHRVLLIDIQLVVVSPEVASKHPIRGLVGLLPGRTTHSHTSLLGNKGPCSPVIFLQPVFCIGIKGAVSYHAQI